MIKSKKNKHFKTFFYYFDSSIEIVMVEIVHSYVTIVKLHMVHKYTYAKAFTQD